MKYTHLLFFFLFVAPLSAQDTLSLDQAIALALERNFDIQLLKNDVEIAGLNNTKANAGMLPVVNLNAFDNGVSALNFKQKLANGTEIKRPAGFFNSFNTNVSAAWTLYDGGRIYMEKQRLEALEQLGKDQLLQQVQETIASVALAWYTIARQEETIRNLDEVIITIRERYNLASNRLEFGLGNKVDVLQAQIDLNERNKERLLAENGLSEAKSNLNTLLSRAPDTRFAAGKLPTTLPAIPDTAALRQTIIATNPGLDVLERSLRIAKITENQAKTLNKPRVGLTGAYSFQRSDNTTGFSLLSQQHGPALGVNFTMPLYTGGNLSRQKEIARVGVESATLRINQLQLALTQQLMNLAGRSEVYRKALDIERQNLDFARENQKIAAERFRQGLSTALETREAQLTLENALFRVSQGTFDVLVNDVQIRALFVQ